MWASFACRSDKQPVDSISMQRVRFYAFVTLEFVGAGLIGLVVGLLIDRLSKSVISILIVVGILCIVGAFLLARSFWRRNAVDRQSINHLPR